MAYKPQKYYPHPTDVKESPKNGALISAELSFSSFDGCQNFWVRDAGAQYFEPSIGKT